MIYYERITKKEVKIEPFRTMLKIWNEQKWIRYDEFITVNPKIDLFRTICFKMEDKNEYQFLLNETDYYHWRKIKPKFRSGKNE